MMADPLLTQPAIDRLQSAAYELVVEGPATGNARSPSPAPPAHPPPTPTPRVDHQRFRDHAPHHGPRPPRWSLARGNVVVPSRWQATTTVPAGSSVSRGPDRDSLLAPSEEVELSPGMSEHSARRRSGFSLVNHSAQAFLERDYLDWSILWQEC